MRCPRYGSCPILGHDDGCYEGDEEEVEEEQEEEQEQEQKEERDQNHTSSFAEVVSVAVLALYAFPESSSETANSEDRRTDGAVLYMCI